MGLFGVWVVAMVVWHSIQGTLPSAFTMGAVGIAALAANDPAPGLFETQNKG